MSEDILPQIPSRRRFISVAAAAAVAGSLSRIAFADTNQSITEITKSSGGDKTSIRTLHVHAPEAQLIDLKRRIKATRWPERETVTDASQGVRLATMQKLARYWSTGYDWRKVEARLNALPQFVTEIDGLDIHFIHVRSKNANALPMIVTHGWPGSIIEQLKIIGPLTDPLAHGGNASDSFDIVIPSLPGYGFSGKPTATGWDPQRVARAWVALMKRLGYTRYVAQGGDWGNAVTEQMALLAPPELIGIHTNMPATVPDDIAEALKLGTRSINSTISTSTAWATHWKWRTARRRYTGLKIRLLASPRGCSTTTPRVRP
jgi:pimeloyl-ACP methyl ester carboxylesterase